MIKTRVEQDLYGEVKLPADALYGINTFRAIKNLSFSGKKMKHYSSYIQALSYVKKAAALANIEAGVVSDEIGNLIISASEEILEENYSDHFLIDMLHGGGGIAANMNINEVIANLANQGLGKELGCYFPVHPTDHVNLSQSTSDVCHTAVRLALIRSYCSLRSEIAATITKLEEKASEFEEVITIARTCLQDAMQIKLGDTFSGYVAMLKRRVKGLDEAVDSLKKINLGGTVIGSGRGASKEYQRIVVQKLCEVTGLPLSHRENLFDAAQNLDDLAHLSNELRLIASCLIKLAKDLRLLASGPEAGFGELRLPAVQAGSSFFPGKVNPVIPETLLQCCFQVIGCDRAVQATLEHGELDLNVFEGTAATNLFDAMQMLCEALATFHENCLAGLEANEKRCLELSTSFIPLIVELKEKVGYSVASKMARELDKEGLKDYLSGGVRNE
ncbi:aspartate ammonia-lyase [Alkalihalophilus pseudofirmus]|uniref:lyase family protein n=1 Tax=Alkalihalophilus pseudofirmus TaxID=79885 RepID=UPI0009512B2F|nr:aspartate ammonia-lyase [Alkalihalophilus pseudofirmus]